MPKVTMQTILRFSKDSWGEDRIFTDGRRFIIADGSTPVRSMPCAGFHSNAEWMADAFVRFAADNPQIDDYPSLCTAFLDASRSDPRIADLADTDLPCFTTAAVFLSDNTLTAYDLSDCSVILKFNDGTVRRWCDDRTKAFSDKTLKAKEDAIAKGLDPAPFVAEQKAKNRAAMNTPGAFWTVFYRGDIKKEFTVLSFPKDEVRSFLICSDGFARLFEYPGGIAPEDVFAPDFSLEEAFVLLRSLEASAASPSQVKAYDDVSAILYDLTE